MRTPVTAMLVTAIVTAACGGSNNTSPTSPTASCTINVAQSVNIAATGGATAVPITTGTSCAWTVTSNQAWLTITSGTGGAGSSTVTFTAAENTGAQRTATVTIGGVAVTVTQAAGLPPLALVGTPTNPTAGVAYQFQFSVTGNQSSVTYSLETGVGFPPIGIVLSPSGLLSGTTTSTSAATFGVCATETGGRTKCERFTLTPAAATAGGAFLGSWRGTIVLTDGCTTPLPQSYSWTGTLRAAAGGGSELVISVPGALVFGDTYAVTVTGQRLQFVADFEGLLTFVADFSADFRSLSGTFTGVNCAVPPTEKIPRGNWNGTKQ